MQLVAQLVPLHTYPAVQLFEVPGWQVPCPSQLEAEVPVAPEQEAAAQTVPAGQSWQPPLPSQEPFCWQVEGTWIAQSWAGSVPAATGPQVPSAPWPFFAAEHAVHDEVHAESQHTPSTQKPVEHWSPEVHAIPPLELLELELELVVPESLAPASPEPCVQRPPEHV